MRESVRLRIGRGRSHARTAANQAATHIAPMPPTMANAGRQLPACSVSSESMISGARTAPMEVPLCSRPLPIVLPRALVRARTTRTPQGQ